MGARGRHAGPQMEKGEGFFLKNSDAHGMYKVSSQEGKCLMCVVSCGNRDLAWGWGGGACKCLQLQRARPPGGVSGPWLSSCCLEGPLSHKSTVSLLPQSLHLEMRPGLYGSDRGPSNCLL